MSEPKIPTELVYSPDELYANVVMSRNEVSMTNATPAFAYTGNNRIEFRVTSSNFIDLASLEVYANISTALAGGTSTHTAGNATKYLPEGTMSLFSDITLSSASGTVIEQVSNAQVLGQVVHNLSASPGYLDTVGSFANNQVQSYERKSAAGNGVRVRISAHKLLGFLSCGKYVKPSSFGGGLILSLTMAPDSTLGVVRDAGGTAETSLSLVTLVFDDLLVTPAYADLYRQDYESQSFRIGFSSWGSQAVNVAAGSSRSVPFSGNARRCKALVAVSRRKDDVLNKRFPSTAFLSSGYSSHNFEVSGVRYPAGSCNGHSQAAEEIIKYARAKMDCQMGSNQNMAMVSSDWVESTGDDRSSQLNGKFMAVFDAEKVGTHDQSGIKLEPGSCQFNLTQTFASETEVTFCWLYDRYVTLAEAQIMIDY